MRDIKEEISGDGSGRAERDKAQVMQPLTPTITKQFIW